MVNAIASMLAELDGTLFVSFDHEDNSLIKNLSFNVDVVEDEKLANVVINSSTEKIGLVIVFSLVYCPIHIIPYFHISCIVSVFSFVNNNPCRCILSVPLCPSSVILTGKQIG